LVCHKIDLSIAARDACIRAVESGTVSQYQIEEASQRIATLQRTHQQRQIPVTKQVNTQAHAHLVEEILRFRA
jgi:hypothetical protein